MNRQMWANAATQRNVAQLVADGVIVLGPGVGDQACGETGDGRMLEPEEIFAALVAWAQPKVLARQARAADRGPDVRGDRPGARHHQLELRQDGLRARAGGRRSRRGRDAGERADDACARRRTSRASTWRARRTWPPRCRRASARATSSSRWPRSPTTRPTTPSATKLKKDGAPLTLTLKPTVDILATVAARPDAPFCVGFAAESHDVERHGEEKRRRKKLPLLIANRAQDALGSDDNEVTLLDDAGRASVAADGQARARAAAGRGDRGERLG